MFLLERPDHCTAEPKRRPLRQNYHSGTRWKGGSENSGRTRRSGGSVPNRDEVPTCKQIGSLFRKDFSVFLSLFLSALCCKALSAVYLIGIHKKADKQLFDVAPVRALKEPLLHKSLTGVTYRVSFS